MVVSPVPQLPPLSLYIHVPWCLQKCPYCDFNSHAMGPQPVPEQAYVDKLLADLETEAVWAQGRPLQSIFIGGGTPSLLSAEALTQLLQGVRQQLDCEAAMEVTLEANPGTFEVARFAGFRAAGVNRLSIGVQSFDDGCLQRLGRVHNAQQAQTAITAAQTLGFEHINVDLMHGLPGQSLAMAEADLEQAIDCATDHLSWYQLTLEPNTLFYSQPPVLPDEDALVDIQDRGQALLQSAGFAQYEVSAWCQPGNTARHNLNYWQFGDYLGIGAGAHGKVSSINDGHLEVQRRVKLRQPKAYLQSMQPLAANDYVAVADLPLEFFMNVLRLRQGVPENLYAQRTGLALHHVGALNRLRQRGLLVAERLQTTALGWRFLNEVLADFES
ncbi:MAG: radical SAM family heme chaperone HemW [Gammaproteobacteria bacterium]|jgi:oxygen-independent coproporphyrinogen-3 oxidase|nr:radical SAM family heme chaperone HemW [Gammaproteobacteria bacterium]